LFDAKIGTLESDLADLLALLIEEYEQKHCKIEEPDSIKFIKLKLEHTNLT